ncbi:hypothetical protein C8Q80DRAFT_1124119 [Daedaleopsis nitida]|nr:hypothetical protein C8Q80DRAFT_1124119 [Daedaleopsis nitida]
MPGLYNWAEARVWPSSVAQLPSLKLDIHDMCSCRASKVCNLPLLVKVHSTPRKLKGSAELKNKKRRLARDRSITAIFTVNLCSNMSNTRIKAGLTRLGTTSLSESRPWLLPTRSKMQMQPLCSLALPADGDWAICVLPKPTARPDVRHPAGARRVLRRDGERLEQPDGRGITTERTGCFRATSWICVRVVKVTEPGHGRSLCMDGRWKLGQLRATNAIPFVRISYDRAVALHKGATVVLPALDSTIAFMSPSDPNALLGGDIHVDRRLHTIPADPASERPGGLCGDAGDSAILVEFGEMSLSLDFSIRADGSVMDVSWPRRRTAQHPTLLSVRPVRALSGRRRADVPQVTDVSDGPDVFDGGKHRIREQELVRADHPFVGYRGQQAAEVYASHEDLALGIIVARLSGLQSFTYCVVPDTHYAFSGLLTYTRTTHLTTSMRRWSGSTDVFDRTVRALTRFVHVLTRLTRVKACLHWLLLQTKMRTRHDENAHRDKDDDSLLSWNERCIFSKNQS